MSDLPGPRVSFLKRWGRRLIVLGIAQFAVSTALLLLAATSYWSEPPRWGQVLDVLLAFSLVITAGGVAHAAREVYEASVWRQSYRIATYIPTVVLILLWLFRHTFDFNFLTGVAWRVWLAISILPSMIALWRAADPKTRSAMADASA